MLHRLVSGTVLSQADRVMCHHKQRPAVAQRCHADGRPHVVCRGYKRASGRRVLFLLIAMRTTTIDHAGKGARHDCCEPAQALTVADCAPLCFGALEAFISDAPWASQDREGLTIEA